MTDGQSRDREIRAWIHAEAPDRAPDRLRESIRAELVDTRQEQRSAMFQARRVAAGPKWAAVAAVVLLAVGAVLGGILRAAPQGPGASEAPAVSPVLPSVSPGVSPSASADVSSSPVPTPSGVLLPAGVYTTAELAPRLQVTLPGGWTLREDLRDTFSLIRPGAGWLRQGDGTFAFDSVNVFARPVAGQPDGVLRPVTGVGTKASDLATWLAKRPQLTATSPVRTTLAGVAAYRLDVRLSPEAGGLCGLPCVNLLDGPDRGAAFQVGLEGPWRARAWLLDAPDGSTLLVTIDHTDGVGFASEVAAAQPIVDSLTFAP